MYVEGILRGKGFLIGSMNGSGGTYYSGWISVISQITLAGFLLSARYKIQSLWGWLTGFGAISTIGQKHLNFMPMPNGGIWGYKLEVVYFTDHTLLDERFPPISNRKCLFLKQCVHDERVKYTYIQWPEVVTSHTKSWSTASARLSA